MKTRYSILLGIQLVAVGLAAPASATTKTTWIDMPGLACLPDTWNASIARAMYSVEPNGRYSPGIYNTSSAGGMLVECPIPLVRDSDLISAGPVTVGDVTFLAADRNSSFNDLFCWATLADESGGYWESPPTATPSGGLNAWQRFTIWDPFAGHNLDLAHFQGSALRLSCALPGTGTVQGKYSGIMSYRASLSYQNQP